MLRALGEKLDTIPEPVLLLGNAGLAGFVMLAHGGALLLTYFQPHPDVQMIRTLAACSLPLSILVIVSAALAWLKPRLRSRVLAMHGVVLVVSAILLLGWAAKILATGIPTGNFSWSPGLMSGWVWYAFYILRRYTLPASVRQTTVGFYLHFIALATALPVDLGVFMRLAARMQEFFQS